MAVASAAWLNRNVVVRVIRLSATMRQLARRDYAFDLQSEPLTPDNIARFDCVVLATDHDAFDYALLQRHARVIVDTRGRLAAASNTVAA